ncbi:MAG: serine/threonine transporter SstT [Succinivibrio sp.]|nr:serine/threonine transporter SstT [Succinivibrio sp.]
MLESFNPKAPLAQTLNKIPFILQIIIGLAFGVLVAYIYPDDKTVIPTFGTLFVKALKAVAPLLIFVLVTSAIAKHKSGSQTNLKPIIALYFAGMVISGTLALGLSYLFPSTFTELAASENVSAPKGVVEVLVNFVNQAVENPVSAFMNCNFVAILVWSIALGLMFRVSKESTKLVLDDVATAVSGVIRFVIRCAPLGVFGLVYNSCTQEGGFSNLLNYVHVVGVLVLTMFIVALIFNPLLVFLTTGSNPYPLVFKCLVKSGLTAFFTRSSAANLPVNMALCEELKLKKETYSISIPLGCTINMSGAGITIVVMTMAAAHTLGIEVSFGAAFLMCIASVLCACGSSGVAGGSLMLIPLACSIFGIPSDVAMQVVGIGFIIGVVQDSCETALNSSTDVIFTAASCMRAEKKALQNKENA